MEARRLRLYVVAYLRGLLQPYYDRGVYSVTRENLVLTALDNELTREVMNHSALVDASLLSGVENRTGLYGKIYDKLRDSREMSEFKTDKSKFTSKDRRQSTPLSTSPSGRKNLISTYKLLQKTGLWEDIEALFDDD